MTASNLNVPSVNGGKTVFSLPTGFFILQGNSGSGKSVLSRAFQYKTVTAEDRTSRVHNQPALWSLLEDILLPSSRPLLQLFPNCTELRSLIAESSTFMSEYKSNKGKEKTKLDAFVANPLDKVAASEYEEVSRDIRHSLTSFFNGSYTPRGSDPKGKRVSFWKRCFNVVKKLDHRVVFDTENEERKRFGDVLLISMNPVLEHTDAFKISPSEGLDFVASTDHGFTSIPASGIWSLLYLFGLFKSSIVSSAMHGLTPIVLSPRLASKGVDQNLVQSLAVGSNLAVKIGSSIVVELREQVDSDYHAFAGCGRLWVHLNEGRIIGARFRESIFSDSAYIDSQKSVKLEACYLINHENVRTNKIFGPLSQHLEDLTRQVSSGTDFAEVVKSVGAVFSSKFMLTDLKTGGHPGPEKKSQQA